MSDAQKILDMIEAVDPEDTDTLDEIDVRTLCLKAGWEFVSWRLKTKTLQYHSICTVTAVAMPHPKYTRSRDALDAIRTPGWRFYHIQTRPDGYTYMAVFYAISFKTRPVSTECLAELYAIVQAWEYERGGLNA